MDIPLVPYISWDWEGHLAEATHGNMEILFRWNSEEKMFTFWGKLIQLSAICPSMWHLYAF